METSKKFFIFEKTKLCYIQKTETLKRFYISGSNFTVSKVNYILHFSLQFF